MLYTFPVCHQGTDGGLDPHPACHFSLIKEERFQSGNAVDLQAMMSMSTCLAAQNDWRLVEDNIRSFHPMSHSSRLCFHEPTRAKSDKFHAQTECVTGRYVKECLPVMFT